MITKYLDFCQYYVLQRRPFNTQNIRQERRREEEYSLFKIRQSLETPAIPQGIRRPPPQTPRSYLHLQKANNQRWHNYNKKQNRDLKKDRTTKSVFHSCGYTTNINGIIRNMEICNKSWRYVINNVLPKTSFLYVLL